MFLNLEIIPFIIQIQPSPNSSFPIPIQPSPKFPWSSGPFPISCSPTFQNYLSFQQVKKKNFIFFERPTYLFFLIFYFWLRFPSLFHRFFSLEICGAYFDSCFWSRLFDQVLFFFSYLLGFYNLIRIREINEFSFKHRSQSLSFSLCLTFLCSFSHLLSPLQFSGCNPSLLV